MKLTPERHAAYLRRLAAIKGIETAGSVLPQSRYVDTGELRLHYLEWPAPGRPVVILLHGGAQNAHTWSLACLALSGRYHCLAVDQRGHGDSDWAKDADYNIAANCRDIGGLMDRLGLERAFLVGMSMGGIHALDFAAGQGTRVAALVLVDIAPEIQRAGAEQSVAMAKDSPVEFPDLASARDWSMRGNPARDPDLVMTGMLLRLREDPSGGWRWKFDRRNVDQISVNDMLAERRGLWAKVPDISCPALVLRGGSSPVLLDSDAERLAARLPSGDWARIEGAGHAIQSDNPRALAEHIDAFLGRHEGIAMADIFHPHE